VLFALYDLMSSKHKPSDNVNGGKPNAAELGWCVLDTSYPYRDEYITLRQDRLDCPGTGEIKMTYLDHAGAVAVVPVTNDGQIVLVRQYRYPVDEWLLEIPAGGLHDVKGAPHEEVALKELDEEVGGRARKLTRVGEFYTTAGQSSELAHVYLAHDVMLDAWPKTEQTEEISVTTMPAREVLDLARSGRMKSGFSALAILLCEPLLRELGHL
jgi:ADP-ribose pyrophosphatase